MRTFQCTQVREVWTTATHMTSSAWTETIYLLALRTQWPGACLFAFCSVYLPACIGHGPWVSEFAGLVAALHGRLSQLLASHVDDRVSQCLAQAEPDLLWNFLGTSAALASATLSTLLPLFAKLPVLCFLRLPWSSSSSSSFSLLCCRRRCAPSSVAFAWLDPQTSHTHCCPEWRPICRSSTVEVALNATAEQRVRLHEELAPGLALVQAAADEEKSPVPNEVLVLQAALTQQQPKAAA